MNQPPIPLPPEPTAASARRDWYRFGTIFLAVVSLVGAAVSILSLVVSLPDEVVRTALAATLVAVGLLLVAAAVVSRTPHIET